MAGVSTSLTTIGLDAAMRRLVALEGFEAAELADDAGAILESSTRGRFQSKEAPDGEAWTPWSEAYDETRNHAKHSLLVDGGDLNDSIAAYASGTEVQIGTAMIYGAHHHFGGDEIGSGVPARPYLGVSHEDELDLTDLVTGRLRGVLL